MADTWQYVLGLLVLAFFISYIRWSNIKAARQYRAVHSITYHFVWSTLHRRRLLDVSVQDTLKDAVRLLCKRYVYELLAIEVGLQYVYVAISAPPEVAPAVIFEQLAKCTARRMSRKHPELRKYGPLWDRDYVVLTSGANATEIVKSYFDMSYLKLFKTDAERETEATIRELFDRLYAIEKAQNEKGAASYGENCGPGQQGPCAGRPY